MTYQEAMAATSRQLNIRATLTLADTTEYNLTNQHIVAYLFDEGANEVPLGATMSTSYTLELANAGGEWFPGGSIIENRVLVGARVSVEVGVYHDGAFDYKPAGVWFVAKATGKESEARFILRGNDALMTGYNMALNDSGLTYGAGTTLDTVLNHIKATHGVTIGGTLACNSGAIISKRPDWGDGCSVRNALAFIAGAGGCFLWVDRAGDLQLKPVKNTAAAKAIGTSAYTELENGHASFDFNRIKVMPRGAKSNAPYIQSAVNSGLIEAGNNTIVMTDNPVFAAGASNLQAMTNALKTALSGYTVPLITIRHRGDPTIIPGDKLEITDRRAKSFVQPVLLQSFKFSQGLSAVSSSMISLAVMQPGAISRNGTILPIGFGKGSLDPNVLIAKSITADQIMAGAITSDEIAADSIDTGHLKAGAITADKAIIADAAIKTAQIQDASITTAKMTSAAVDDIKAGSVAAVQALFQQIAAGTITTGDFVAGVAKVAAAEIGTADIDWAHIKDLVTDTAIITEGVAGELYIARLAVTEANIVSLSVGELMVRGDDGLMYTVTVDEEGSIITVPSQVTNDDLMDAGAVIDEGENIIYGGITAGKLNVQEIFAENALIASLIAANIDVDELFAREATIDSLNAKLLLTDNYITVTNAISGIESELTENKSYIRLGKLINSDNAEDYGIAIGKSLQLDEDGNIVRDGTAVQITSDRQTFYQNGVVGMELKDGGVNAGHGNFGHTTVGGKWKTTVDANGTFAITWVG